MDNCSNLNDAAREERNRYLRNWRREHRDNVRAANKRYWEKRVEKADGKTAPADRPSVPAEGG